MKTNPNDNCKENRIGDRGNKGIGLEISRNLSSAGCTVLLGARNVEAGHQAVQHLAKAGLTPY